MEYLQTLLDNSEIPIITAFLLGLLTAVSPCQLATNITAIGFISKDINNRNLIFTNGILYTLGRVLAQMCIRDRIIFFLLIVLPGVCVANSFFIFVSRFSFHWQRPTNGCYICSYPVSYTHLDVYKRQIQKKIRKTLTNNG